jgi:hypothetical protein
MTIDPMDLPQHQSPKLPAPPDIVLNADSSFEEVMAELKGIQVWCNRLFMAYNVQNTELVDARFSLQMGIKSLAEYAGEYIRISNQLADVEIALLALTSKKKEGFWPWQKTRTLTDPTKR